MSEWCNPTIGSKMIEPTELDNDLEERLLSARNMIDLTLLALNCDKHELIPTGLEELFYKTQKLLDDYCVVSK